LGIGDWAQSPIPNPQSPIPNPHRIVYKYNINSLEINRFGQTIISKKQLIIKIK
jgi:hypothetical protein